MSKLRYETRGGDSREVESVAVARAQLEADGLVVSDQWDDYGAEDRRMLVWASEADSVDDCGAKAVGQIVEYFGGEEVER